LIWVGLLAVAAHQTWSRHHEQHVVLQLPGGRAAVRPLVAEKFAWLQAHTRAGQLFFDAGWLGPYLPLALRNPLFLDDMGGYMFRQLKTAAAAGDTERRSQARMLEYVQVCTRTLLAKQVEYVVWKPSLGRPPFHVPMIREFLEQNYRKVHTFTDENEVWELKPELTAHQAYNAPTPDLTGSW
jgi:hypothetical protein